MLDDAVIESRHDALRDLFEKFEQDSEPVWVLEGLAVERSTMFGFLVAYVDEPEEGIKKVVPLGVGWLSLFDFLEGYLEENSDDEEKMVTLHRRSYTPAQLAAVDTENF